MKDYVKKRERAILMQDGLVSKKNLFVYIQLLCNGIIEDIPTDLVISSETVNLNKFGLLGPGEDVGFHIKINRLVVYA